MKPNWYVNHGTGNHEAQGNAGRYRVQKDPDFWWRAWFKPAGAVESRCLGKVASVWEARKICIEHNREMPKLEHE